MTFATRSLFSSLHITKKRGATIRKKQTTGVDRAENGGVQTVNVYRLEG
jgi:hypothetical protein